MKKMLLPAVCALLATSLFSCEKTYMCQCYTYQAKRPYYVNNVSGTFELRERDRKGANYKCVHHSHKISGTDNIMECKIIQ